MAQVANCPQCKHDLLVPEEVDGASWAKCPECRALFQFRQTAPRELPVAVLVESPSIGASPNGVEPASSADGLPSSAPADDPGDLTYDITAPVVDAHGPGEPPPSDKTKQLGTAERIDEWFRSSKTVADSPEIAAIGPMDIELGDLGANDDVELADAPTAAESRAPWDDSPHMEQLLANLETPASELQAADAAAPEATDAPTVYEDPVAGASASDLPVFSKPANGKPRRKRSLLRTLAMTVVAGAVGLALGYYALLWLRGPSGDFLNVAHYLPGVVLPAELHAKSQPLPVAREAAPPVEQAPIAADPATAPAEPAEIQATFTTTEETPSAVAQETDERYAIEATGTPPPAEPAPLGEQAGVPMEFAATAPRPAGAPSFSPDELNAALKAAEEAQPALTTGSLRDGREIQLAKGKSYAIVADLAQKVALVEDSADPATVADARQAAETLFQQALASALTRADVAAIVPKWIASPHRKHGGVFFSASIVEPREAGSVVEARGELETGQSLPLLVPMSLAGRVDSSRPIVVIGWLVDQAADTIPGYTGQARQAVWVGDLVPLQ